MFLRRTFLLLLAIIYHTIVPHRTLAQGAGREPSGSVFVDKKGVLRWEKGKEEVALFGVNYTTPFAYSYRAHQRLGVPHEQAIAQDVYHLARLGVTAFGCTCGTWKLPIPPATCSTTSTCACSTTW